MMDLTDNSRKKQASELFEHELPAGLRLSVTRYGFMLSPRSDQYVGNMLHLYGEWMQAEVDLFATLIKPGMTIVDAGANIGAFTLPLSRLAGPTGSIHAYEPQRPLFQLLCTNVVLNGLTNVHSHHVGLSSERGYMRTPKLNYFGNDIINFAGVSLETGSDGEEVEIRPLDDFHLSELHFMKVDVESMEVQLLRGAARTISFHRPILFMENDSLENSPRLIQALMDLNYRLWWHISMPFNPYNYNNHTENYYGLATSNNMLCVPRESAFETYLREITSPDQTWKDIVDETVDDYIRKRDA